jgi:cytochrome c biogenesis protein CcdA
VRAASFPAAFVLGILSGLFGFSCTGGIYITILGLMGREFSLMSGLPYLILYNLVFVIPLVLVLMLAAYGIPMEHADTLKIRYRRVLRIIVGITMIALGIIIFSGWVG